MTGDACSLPKIAARLEARRRELGWSIERLAHTAGYHRNTVLRTLHGDNVRWQTVTDVAGALGLAMEVIRFEITLTENMTALGKAFAKQFADVARETEHTKR